MKRIFFALFVVLAVAAVSLPASAAPPGHEKKGGDEFVCDEPVGTVMIFGGSGRSGWIGDTLYLATEVSFTGTFTPTEGDVQVFEFNKVWGKGPTGDLIHCTTHFEDSDATGTFVLDGEVWAVRAPRR